VNFQ